MKDIARVALENTLTRKQLQLETLVAGSVATAISITVLNRDWCERLCDWLMRYEPYEADEFVLVGFVFAVMFIVLLFRRERQLHFEIRRRQTAEQEAHWAARHDHLTSLPNRLAFTEQFGPGAARDTAVFLIDLDGFKSINDTKGHAAGDEVLKIVAARLQRVIASRGAGEVARMGGDEFSCLVRPAPTHQELAAIGQEIVTAISEPIILGGVELRVTPSVGIACSNQFMVHQDELLHRADLAMYLAKRTDSGQVSLFGATTADTIMAISTVQDGASLNPSVGA